MGSFRATAGRGQPPGVVQFAEESILLARVTRVRRGRLFRIIFLSRFPRPFSIGTQVGCVVAVFCVLASATFPNGDKNISSQIATSTQLLVREDTQAVPGASPLTLIIREPSPLVEVITAYTPRTRVAAVSRLFIVSVTQTLAHVAHASSIHTV